MQVLGDQAANTDLWDELYQLRQSKLQWAFSLHWVNSHAECELDLSPDIDGVIYKANAAADHWAKDVAAMGQIPA